MTSSAGLIFYYSNKKRRRKKQCNHLSLHDCWIWDLCMKANHSVGVLFSSPLNRIAYRCLIIDNQKSLNTNKLNQAETNKQTCTVRLNFQRSLTSKRVEGFVWYTYPDTMKGRRRFLLHQPDIRSKDYVIDRRFLFSFGNMNNRKDIEYMLTQQFK